MIDIQKKGALFVLVPLLILGLSVTACENTEELVDPSSTTGMVVIDISPDDIDAPWELILPDGSTIGGNGDAALRDLVPGSYQLNFGTVPGYGSPTPRSQTLEAGDELRLTGTYVARSAPTGSVDINPDPDEIGADWFLTVDGKLAARGSGDSTLTDVSTGEIQLIWNPVQEWAAPQPNPSIQALFEDSLITFAGTYTPLPDGDLGWIVVRPLPEGIEAPWTLSGPQAAGGVGEFQLPGVPVGDYTIEWGEVFGYKTPKPSAGTLTDQEILEFETVYEPATGTITVDPSPDSIGAPWTLTPAGGSPSTGNGDTTLHDLPVGEYSLRWGEVDGWIRPVPAQQDIFLSVDETRRLTGTYDLDVITTGTVTVQVSPGGASWNLVGPDLDQDRTGNVTFPDVEPGEYVIEWQPLSGWILPDPIRQTMTLSAGETLTFVGAYTNPDAPSIGTVLGDLQNGASLTITGSDFGQHTLDISSAAGPNGWIETNALGTSVRNLTDADGWSAGFTNNYAAFIDNSRTRTGSHAINASIDRSADGDWQKPVTYYGKVDGGFRSLYATWWVYVNPTKIGRFVQWKMWYAGPTNHHSTCSSATNTSSFSMNPLSFNYYLSAFPCCTQGPCQGTCYDAVETDPYYAPYSGDPSQYRYHNRAQTESYEQNHPGIGRWTRYEIFMAASDPGMTNGRYELYSTKEGEVRNHVDTWIGVKTHDAGCTYGTADPTSPWRYWGLHGYFDDNGGPFDDEEVALYYDDIYLQFGTKARVEIGDEPVYEQCRQREVQTPQEWTMDSITIDLNHGAFSAGDDVYLFVINERGEASAGRLISLE